MLRVLRPAAPAALGVLLASSCSTPATAPDEAARPARADPVPGPTLPGRLISLAEDADGGHADHASAGAIVAMQPDGSGRKELLRGVGVYPAAVDPTGAALAVIVVDEQNGGHQERLAIYAWSSGSLDKPTWSSPPASHVRNPSWGPEGRFIAFEAAFESFRDIYRVELPAGTMLRLTDNQEGNFEPAVAPDGQQIAFVSSRDGNAEVYRMQADGAGQTRLTSFPLDDWGPMWAPDGKTLAFLSNREQIDRIFLMAPEGGEQRRLTPDPSKPPDPDGTPGDEPHETDPAFSPDGAALAYCVRTGTQGASLRISPLAGGPPIVLSEGRFSDRNPVWSPDGSHLVFVSNRDAGDLELYRIERSAGARPTRLTERPGADWLPRWSPR